MLICSFVYTAGSAHVSWSFCIISFSLFIHSLSFFEHGKLVHDPNCGFCGPHTGATLPVTWRPLGLLAFFMLLVFYFPSFDPCDFSWLICYFFFFVNLEMNKFTATHHADWQTLTMNKKSGCASMYSMSVHAGVLPEVLVCLAVHVLERPSYKTNKIH